MGETLILILQFLALAIFVALIFPLVKSENWKEKFIDNKHARSILIVFILILALTTLMGVYLDTFFPVEILR